MTTRPLLTLKITTSAELNALAEALTQYIDDQDECVDMGDEPSPDVLARIEAAEVLLRRVNRVFDDLADRERDEGAANWDLVREADERDAFNDRLDAHFNER